MKQRSRVEGFLMTVIIAALAVAAVASWSHWSISDAPVSAPTPAVTEAVSPANPAATVVTGPASAVVSDAR